MALEGLRAAAPAAAPAPARGRPSDEAVDGMGFGAALAACERGAPTTAGQAAEAATDAAADTTAPAKDKDKETEAGTAPAVSVAVEAPSGDAAWLAQGGNVPRLPTLTPAATPAPGPTATRAVGFVGTAESSVSARAATPAQPQAANDAAVPSAHPAPATAPTAADGATAAPATALLLQQQRIAQRDAAAATEPSARQTLTALAQRPGAELQALPGMGLLSPEGQGPPRRWERASASAGPVAGTGPSSLVGGDASAPSPFLAPVDAASAGASLSHPGLAERMTEQVSWWMAQKTQGAELSMALDGRPVSVSVKLQGNEAQVVFRSDQPEARQMLTQALPELKQMFGNEGLLLSQASVGSQARDPQGQGGPPARPPGAGRASAGVVDAVEVRPRVMALRADGSRPLDLYV